jgi:hypothetical protein
MFQEHKSGIQAYLFYGSNKVYTKNMVGWNQSMHFSFSLLLSCGLATLKEERGFAQPI